MKSVSIMKVFIIVSLFVAGPSFASEHWPDNLMNDMENAAIAIADNWTDDRDPTKQDWSWGEGVLAYGLIKTADWSGRSDFFNWVDDYLIHHQNEDPDIIWSDHCSPAISAFYISANMNPEKEVYPIAEKVVDYIMTAPRTESQNLLIHLGERADVFPYNVPGYPDAWVDSLFHITATLAQYSTLTGNNAYIEEAVYQVNHFIINLQDPDTGLVAHAYFDYPENRAVPAFSNDEFWARGNGWALVSLVELLSFMDENHPSRAALLNMTVRLEEALRNNQGSDGRYHTLVTKSSTYYETAGTALILYAMAKGYELGIFPDSTRNAVIEGAESLLGNTIKWNWRKTQAVVKYTSIGTNPTPGLYRFVPRQSQVSYGNGAWLMLASEIVD